MYYLDFHGLYKHTTLSDRISVRRHMTPEVRNLTMQRRLKLQHNHCFWCGDDIDMKGNLDHIIPVYYGGNNAPVNLVAACIPCNMTKLTDQIEIKNTFTIDGYLRLIAARKKWDIKLDKAPNDYVRRVIKRHIPKKVQLYKVYRADLFKEI